MECPIFEIFSVQIKNGMRVMDLGYRFEKGVYLISPEKIPNLAKFALELKFILKRVKVSFFQLRLKDINEVEVIEAIQVLRPICIKFKTNFVLNDNALLAAKYATDALHIGKLDGDPNEARRQFHGIIGVSCYGDVDRAVEMASKTANYVSFGAFYPSKTKPEAKICDTSLIKKFKERSKVRVCAVGGINSSNAKILIQNGADLIALSSAVWSLSKPTLMVNEIAKLIALFN